MVTFHVVTDLLLEGGWVVQFDYITNTLGRQEWRSLRKFCLPNYSICFHQLHTYICVYITMT